MFTQEDAELYNHPLSYKVIGCAIEVHRQLGSGLLESTYESCLAHEMHLQKLSFKLQSPIPVVYTPRQSIFQVRICKLPGALDEKFIEEEPPACDELSRVEGPAT